jgi:hypothetical protein
VHFAAAIPNYKVLYNLLQVPAKAPILRQKCTDVRSALSRVSSLEECWTETDSPGCTNICLKFEANVIIPDKPFHNQICHSNFYGLTSLAWMSLPKPRRFLRSTDSLFNSQIQDSDRDWRSLEFDRFVAYLINTIEGAWSKIVTL